MGTGVALIKFPDFYSRMHASSKCLVGGGVSILLASILKEGISPVTYRLIVLIIFLLVTNPVVAHALSKSAYQIGVIPENMIRDDMKEGAEKNE